MKHLLIIFSLLLTSVSWSKDVDVKDLVKRDGLWYEKFSNEPFTGTSTGRFQGKIKNGKAVGEILSYHNNGQLWIKKYIKDGKNEGERLAYHENGQLWGKSNWKEGKLIGEKLSYYKNGQLKEKSNYINSIVINLVYSALVLPCIYFSDNDIVCKYWFFSLLLIYIIIYNRLYHLTKN